MRERLAIIVLASVLAVLVGLAVAFAWRHNQESPVTTPAPFVAATTGQVSDRGRAVFREQNCALCHALRGIGNPRHPLDGVGAKLTEANLRNAILGTGQFSERLSSPVIQRKERYRQLPEDDLAALIAYLSSQRVSGPTP